MTDDGTEKVGQVVLLTRQDMPLIGGSEKGYGAHCLALLNQLHEYHQENGNIFACVAVSSDGYRRFLNGRRPQPEWMYDYFAHAKHSVIRQAVNSDALRIVARLPPVSESEAVRDVAGLMESASEKATFYLPLDRMEGVQKLVSEWENRLAVLLLIMGDL